MLDHKAIAEIIATYHKYGWLLRRVLLTAALKQDLHSQLTHLFGDVAIKDADINAIWFSRQPVPGLVTWEIRHLSKDPFALLEAINEDDAGFEAVLSAVESRLGEAAAKVRSA